MKTIWRLLLALSVLFTVTLFVALAPDAKHPVGFIALLTMLFLLTGGFPLWRVVRGGSHARPFEPKEPLETTSSPSPWISDAVWQRRKQWSRFPLLKSGEEKDKAGGRQLLADADVVAVDESRRSARPTSDARPVKPPPMSVDEARGALARTEDAGAFWNPVSWPMCCGALTVLVLVNPTRAELEGAEAAMGSLSGADSGDGSWREALASIRAGDACETGINVFQCGGCGRTYGHESH